MDAFGFTYVDKEDSDQLLSVLENQYEWDYDKIYVRKSMPGYDKEALV